MTSFNKKVKFTSLALLRIFKILPETGNVKIMLNIPEVKPPGRFPVMFEGMAEAIKERRMFRIHPPDVQKLQVRVDYSDFAVISSPILLLAS